MEEKKKSYKGIVIFLLALGLVAVTATSFYANSINRNKNKSEINEKGLLSESGEYHEKTENDSFNDESLSGDEEIDYQKLAKEDQKYISALDENYYTNNIELIEEKYTSGEVVKDQYNDEKLYEENVIYYQIDGLKDEKIEKKINERLKEEAFKCLQEKSNKKIKIIETRERANFSNILSVIIDFDRFDNNYYEEEAERGRIYINIDLSTGKDIKLEDLFVRGTSIKNIISKSIYENEQHNEYNLIGYFMYVEENLEKLGINADYGNISEDEIKRLGLFSEEEWRNRYIRSVHEGKALKAMLKLETNEPKLGYIDEEYIYYYFGDKIEQISLRKNLDKIALYKRFLKEESIFTDEYNNAVSQICGNGATGMDSGFMLDNLYTHNDGNFTKEEVVYTKEKIKAETEYAKLAKDTVFLILNYKEYTEKYEIPVEEYEKNKEKILKELRFCRRVLGGSFF